MSQPSSNQDDMFEAQALGDLTSEGGAMAEPPVVEPQYRKQGFSIYTMMLILSFLCLTTAAILFFI